VKSSRKRQGEGFSPAGSASGDDTIGLLGPSERDADPTERGYILAQSQRIEPD